MKMRKAVRKKIGNEPSYLTIKHIYQYKNPLYIAIKHLVVHVIKLVSIQTITTCQIQIDSRLPVAPHSIFVFPYWFASANCLYARWEQIWNSLKYYTVLCPSSIPSILFGECPMINHHMGKTISLC